MDIVFKFLTWFTISFPILIAVDSLFPSRIFLSFIIALIFGFLAVRGEHD